MSASFWRDRCGTLPGTPETGIHAGRGGAVAGVDPQRPGSTVLRLTQVDQVLAVYFSVADAAAG